MESSASRLNQGDAFERGNATWLNCHLCFYARIWEAFIGCDRACLLSVGEARPLPMHDLNTEQETNRIRFYQAHYSLARDAHKVWEVTEDGKSYMVETGTPDELDAAQDMLLEYSLYLGRIHDDFKAMESALKTNGISTRFDEFFARRSNLIHGPRVPLWNDDGILKIPTIAGRMEIGNQWHDKADWNAAKSKDYRALGEYMEESTNDLFLLLNQCHGAVFNSADKYFEGRRVQWPEVSLTWQGFDDHWKQQGAASMPLPTSGTRNFPPRS